MTAQLSATSAAAFNDEIDDLDDFDEDGGEDERGLSGLVVLLMGIVMLGALASVVWIAYQYGVRTGEERSGAPYVTADPEPLKIENQIADAGNAAAGGVGSEVYDSLGGAASEPVEVIAAGPEEPVARDSADPIGTIAAGESAGEDAVADRIAELAKADAALAKDPVVVAATPQAAPKSAPKIEQKPATAPTQANVSKPAPTPATPTPVTPTPVTTAAASGDALSGSHLVQVGAFRSAAEADGVWSSMGGKYGAYLDGKAKDVEVADLGAKGVYYRLRVGPFASADSAKTYCAGLKERGTDCLIKAK